MEKCCKVSPLAKYIKIDVFQEPNFQYCITWQRDCPPNLTIFLPIRLDRQLGTKSQIWPQQMFLCDRMTKYCKS